MKAKNSVSLALVATTWLGAVGWALAGEDATLPRPKAGEIAVASLQSQTVAASFEGRWDSLVAFDVAVPTSGMAHLQVYDRGNPVGPWSDCQVPAAGTVSVACGVRSKIDGKSKPCRLVFVFPKGRRHFFEGTLTQALSELEPLGCVAAAEVPLAVKGAPFVTRSSRTPVVLHTWVLAPPDQAKDLKVTRSEETDEVSISLRGKTYSLSDYPYPLWELRLAFEAGAPSK